MIHLKATCDKRRTKKDGSHPIVFRVSVNGQSRDISSGLSCDARYWDFKKNAVKEKTEELRLLGKRVKDMEINLLNKVSKFEQEFPFSYTIQDVLNFLSNDGKRNNIVNEFWREEVKRLHRSNNHSNAILYENTLLRLEKLTSFSIPFQVINYSWLTELETKLKECGLNTNSVSVNLRTLRSVYNKAVNHGIVDYSHYPFRRFKIKTGISTPRTLSLEEMRKFFSYTPTSGKLEFAHDMGKLILYLRGINFTDLALLTSDQVKNDRLVYQRSKTHKMYSVKILPEARVILNKYSSNVQNLLLAILISSTRQKPIFSFEVTASST